jgi:hypothetical protein
MPRHPPPQGLAASRAMKHDKKSRLSAALLFEHEPG